jgi:hypothetical protein
MQSDIQTGVLPNELNARVSSNQPLICDDSQQERFKIVMGVKRKRELVPPLEDMLTYEVVRPACISECCSPHYTTKLVNKV